MPHDDYRNKVEVEETGEDARQPHEIIHLNDHRGGSYWLPKKEQKKKSHWKEQFSFQQPYE